jgi:hypothetical protein
MKVCESELAAKFMPSDVLTLTFCCQSDMNSSLNCRRILETGIALFGPMISVAFMMEGIGSCDGDGGSLGYGGKHL